jgi:hypothetical protein
VITDDKCDQKGGDRPHETPAKLDQVFEQRHRLVVDRIFFFRLSHVVLYRA